MNSNSTNKLIKLTEPKLLICEGIDDENFLKSLVKFLEIKDVRVKSYGGKGNLKLFLKTLPTVPGFDQLNSLGVTRDADDSSPSAFQSVENAIKDQEFSIKTSIFILPDCTNPGMLEDLCIATLEPEESKCINQYLECMYSVKGCLPQNRSKALIYTWLAVQSKPEIRLGEAALQKCFNFSHPTFDSLKEFIKTL